MKLKFKNQDFQTEAVNAVADLFIGQEKSSNTFSIDDNAGQIRLIQNDFGFGNKLLVDDDTLIANMHNIQKRQKLPITRDFDSKQYSIEMETGTGKTYVYTKTILELNKRYGFTKFIIVVPSVAIREGVFKSLQVTEEHFKNLYDSEPYRYFIYNSSKLSDVRSFATSNNIEIMIINIDAFKKAENIINQEQDKLNGETAMRYIKDTNPIVIIDEPQSVDNTPKAKDAIQSLNPLCVLRYSATHREKINLLYRLTPVDAYQMGLVKQICVSSNTVANDFNKPYIYLKSVSNENGFSAKVEIDIQAKDGKVERTTKTVKAGDDLYTLSGKRELYRDYVIEGIDCTKGFECLEFSNSETVMLGKSIGSVDENILKKAQIYRTIEAHLDKELRYYDKGIKVLSLFFIDEVKKYRTETGEKGIYAQMFEECYNELINKPKYAGLKDKFNTDVEKAHNGYFSQDKKGVYKNTKGDTQADDDTYNLIMRDKEMLLSFDCHLRFIFSHSALKEGWDNPNVFQVCTLIEQKSTFTCRQKVGRGLRLCVNQDGERIEDRNINILHVMANESFAEFAETLQKEIEQETGMKFGAFDISYLLDLKVEEKREIEHTINEADAFDVFETLVKDDIINYDGSVKDEEKLETIDLPQISEPLKHEVQKMVKEAKPLTFETLKEIKYIETVVEEKPYFTLEEASEVIEELKEAKVLDKNGKIKDTMKAQLAADKLDIVKRWDAAKKRAVLQALEKADNRPVIRDASREVTVRLKKQAILSSEFRELWDKIKQKTTYRVNFDVEELVKNCIKDLQEMDPIPKARLVSKTAELEIENSGITHTEKHIKTQDLSGTYEVLPDIIRLISAETLLKRSTIIRIIEESGRIQDFINNPQGFYEKALEIISKNRHSLAIDGIKYVKLAGEEYYVQEIFDSSELIANLDKNAIPVEHSVYDYLIYDSGVESRFAESLDNDPDVRMFFKIPDRFKIETPIGTYNPDWAVFLEKDGEQKLYFVLESKGTTSLFDLRSPEQLKIHCGKQHFDTLGVNFPAEPVKDWKEFKAKV